MPAALLTRLSFVAVFAVMLIPVGLSSLRGLDHVLTCSEQVESPFQVLLIPGEDPVVTGAATVDADDEGLLCGGLGVEIQVVLLDDGRVQVTVPVANSSSSDWFGTVEFEVAGVRLPLDVGRIRAGERRSSSYTLNLPDGVTEFDGRLLVGP